MLPKAVSEGCGKKDVLYLALTRKTCGTSTLYFSYLCSKKIFSIKTDYLRDGKANGKIEGKFSLFFKTILYKIFLTDVGTNPEKLVIIGTDNGCAIFFRYEGMIVIFNSIKSS